jgi:DNA helicase-2/ATP-dependent DNA helicase PcrA
VDEFQDTNRAQYDLLRLLSPSKDANLFVVADDDQIIYQWNGASPERLQSIRDDYEMTVIQLPENYRCPPAIIGLANSLIAHNKARSAGKQPLVARRAPIDGDHVWLRRATDPVQEAAQVAADIQTRRLAPADCVVLGRTRKVLEPVLEAMTAAGIPGHLPQQKADFEMPGTKWMFSVLHLGNARADRELLRLVCVTWDALTEVVVEADGVVADAALVGGDLLRAWCERATKSITDEALVKLVGVVKDRLVERLDVLGMLEQFFSAADQLWKDDLATQDELATWRTLNDEIRSEHGIESITLNMYVQEMSLRSKATQPSPGAVRLLTVHGSKGLEFKHVFLVGMAEEVFPSFQALKMGTSSRELEEERRNCFVAITRVQETLTISWAAHYYGYAKKASRFLTEMGLETGVAS